MNNLRKDKHGNQAEQKEPGTVLLLLVNSAKAFARSMNHLGSSFGTMADTMAKIRADYGPATFDEEGQGHERQ